MGLRSYDQGAKEMYRQTFNVPATSGNYASEVITFGPVGSGDGVQYFREIMALVEGFVTGATVELWLAKVPAAGETASGRGADDWVNSGLTTATAAGAVRWQLSAWPGAQIRVKSGAAIGGVMTISASGF
jgi:hypothetical protein